MKTYVIIYQLRNEWENYMSFYEALKTNYPKYNHTTESSWFVKTDDTPQQIVDNIKPFLYPRDTIIVGELTDKHAGFMQTSLWSWLKDND